MLTDGMAQLHVRQQVKHEHTSQEEAAHCSNHGFIPRFLRAAPELEIVGSCKGNHGADFARLTVASLQDRTVPRDLALHGECRGGILST